jgi:hypothetical protein
MGFRDPSICKILPITINNSSIDRAHRDLLNKIYFLIGTHSRVNPQLKHQVKVVPDGFQRSQHL